MAEQSLRFSELQMLERKELVIKRYITALKNGDHWPQDITEELRAYQTKARLDNEPHAWVSRVPKWTRGMASQRNEKKGPPAAEHGGGHEEHSEHGE